MAEPRRDARRPQAAEVRERVGDRDPGGARRGARAVLAGFGVLPGMPAAIATWWRVARYVSRRGPISDRRTIRARVQRRRALLRRKARPTSRDRPPVAHTGAGAGGTRPNAQWLGASN